MALDYAKSKNSTTAFGSVGASYAQAIAVAEGHYIEVKNSTDKDLILRTKNLLGEYVEVRLVTEDFSSRMIPLIHSGDIEIKHAGSAPTRGSVFVQSICAGS